MTSLNPADEVMYRNSRQLHIAVMHKYAAAQRIADAHPDTGSAAWSHWRSLLDQAAKLNDAYATAAGRNVAHEVPPELGEVDVPHTAEPAFAAVV